MKTQVLHLRASPEEIAACKAAAQAAGQSMSTWLRSQLRLPPLGVGGARAGSGRPRKPRCPACGTILRRDGVCPISHSGCIAVRQRAAQLGYQDRPPERKDAAQRQAELADGGRE